MEYFAVGILVGLLLGVVATMLYFGNLVVKATAVLKDALYPETGTPAAAPKSGTPDDKARAKRLIDRVNAASDLSKEQIRLYGMLDQPSKGASHSRWKNDLVAQIKELEERKMVIFREILADGFDPKISVLNDAGQIEKIALSESVKEYDARKASENPPAPPAKGARRLQLVKNEEEKS